MISTLIKSPTRAAWSAGVFGGNGCSHLQGTAPWTMDRYRATPSVELLHLERGVQFLPAVAHRELSKAKQRLSTYTTQATQPNKSSTQIHHTNPNPTQPTSNNTAKPREQKHVQTLNLHERGVVLHSITVAKMPSITTIHESLPCTSTLSLPSPPLHPKLTNPQTSTPNQPPQPAQQPQPS